MVIRFRNKDLAWCLFAVLACNVSVGANGQSSSSEQGSRKSHSHSTQKTANIFENSEVKILIPRGWTAIARPSSDLILAKIGYELKLAYDTGHAGGAEGGRFLEAFDVPWPEVDDGSTCSLYFDRDALPASRILLFRTLIVDTNNINVQKNCGIPKNLGHSTAEEGDVRDLNGERRWFGGYFTTARGGYYFESRGEGCGEKLYTLVSTAREPEDLPAPDDPNLKRVIQQAINIVNSIHYKRCSPFNDAVREKPD
jgi:hypothetical protein